MLGHNGRVGLVAVLAVVFGSATPAAAVERGFSPVSGTIHSSPVPGTGGAVQILTGNLAPFGEINGVLTFTALGADGSFSATFVLCFDDGKVEGEVNGQFTSATEFVEVVKITGGTRAYRGIRGLIALTGELDPATGEATDEVVTGFVFLPWW